MLEQIWDGILEFTSQFVIPDWGSVIALLPVVIAFVAILFFIRVAWAWATAGPTRRGGGRRKPVPPAGLHMPGPSYSPIFAAIGATLLFLGLVFGGWILALGVVALVLTLLYWGREALVEYDHVAGVHPQVPAVVHEGPPPGVHMPGPSFRPLLASIAVAILFAGLVFGGWILAVGVISTFVTLIGWLGDFRREYGHVADADRTGHIATDPAPGWPKAVLWFMAIAVVLAIVVDAGWIPPRSAANEGGGASPGPSAGPSGPPGQITIVAEGVKFNTATLNVPADTPFKLALDNRDAGTPHDVDILDAGGAKLFDGKDFPGVAIQVYDVPPIPAGSYPFICSIHPELMKGQVVAG
jgi:hypothetical protein